MGVLPIVTFPDPILRMPSDPIETVDEAVRTLAADLIDTLNSNTLLGMAAIMVGVRQRMAILAVDALGGIARPIVMINPRIVKHSQETEKGPEGCPSLPEIYEDVERPKMIEAVFMDLSGAEQTLKAGGLQARVIQHQIDLCDGIPFIDHLSRLKRSRIEKKLLKSKRHVIVEE